MEGASEYLTTLARIRLYMRSITTLGYVAFADAEVSSNRALVATI